MTGSDGYGGEADGVETGSVEGSGGGDGGGAVPVLVMESLAIMAVAVVMVTMVRIMALEIVMRGHSGSDDNGDERRCQLVAVKGKVATAEFGQDSPLFDLR